MYNQKLVSVLVVLSFLFVAACTTGQIDIIPEEPTQSDFGVTNAAFERSADSNDFTVEVSIRDFNYDNAEAEPAPVVLMSLTHENSATGKSVTVSEIVETSGITPQTSLTNQVSLNTFDWSCGDTVRGFAYVNPSGTFPVTSQQSITLGDWTSYGDQEYKVTSLSENTYRVNFSNRESIEVSTYESFSITPGTATKVQIGGSQENTATLIFEESQSFDAVDEIELSEEGIAPNRQGFQATLNCEENPPDTPGGDQPITELDFTYEPESIVSGQEAKFQTQNSELIQRYAWSVRYLGEADGDRINEDFGTGPEASYQFRYSGRYEVSLTAKYLNGESKATTKTIEVQRPPAGFN